MEISLPPQKKGQACCYIRRQDWLQRFIIANDFPREGVRIAVEFRGILYLL
jgi:hypothetical protein